MEQFSQIYLDNASTTQISSDVFSAMEPYLKEYYGNASSHYSLGSKSKKAIEDSREIIATSIGCKPQEIYFTSGGSEANSWAIKGFKNPYMISPMHIITDAQEHHSLLNAVDQRGVNVGDIMYSLAKSDNYGLVDLEDIKNLFTLRTRLCSIQTVNNETGIIQPIQKIAFLCKDEGCVFHTDAVQAYGHLKLNVSDLGIDMLSASAHKLHGPKGIGFLFISDEIRNQFVPLINGGQQERGLRGSTENVAAIVGFGKAVEIAEANMEKNYEHLESLSSLLVNKLSRMPGVHTNVNLKQTDYRHISIRLDDIRAEEMLSLLDSVNISVSSGSACNSDSHEPSHVLKAIGLSDKAANSTIRVSLCETNTVAEINAFAEYLESFIKILREEK